MPLQNSNYSQESTWKRSLHAQTPPALALRRAAGQEGGVFLAGAHRQVAGCDNPVLPFARPGDRSQCREKRVSSSRQFTGDLG